MREADFNTKSVAQALEYLREELPRVLNKNAKTEDVLRSEGFAIGYPNVVTALEGYILRQDALVRRAERDLVIEQNKQGRAGKADVAATNARFEEAKRRFCDFLTSASEAGTALPAKILPRSQDPHAAAVRNVLTGLAIDQFFTRTLDGAPLSHLKSDPISLDTVSTTVTATKEAGHARQAAEGDDSSW